MPTHAISVTVNGALEHLEVPSNMTMLRMLRERLALTGTKNGCSAGECGACTVLLNCEPVNSCMILAVEADGAEITTVEGLAKDGQLDVIQQAFVDEGAVQLNRNPNPSEEEIRLALLGHLCRCTGYHSIISGVRRAAKALRKVR